MNFLPALDIVRGEPAQHADPEWLHTDPLLLDGATVPINRYFLRHPAMVLGTWSREDRLYASTYSVVSQGDLSERLRDAIQHLPEHVFTGNTDDTPSTTSPSFTPPPPLAHITEGSFFLGEDQTIQQWMHGEAVPVTHGSTPLKADGTLMGRRLAALITLRDHARRVLHSQNEESIKKSGRWEISTLSGREDTRITMGSRC